MKVLKPALWMALIVNPLSSRALGNLFSTHSPVEERIRGLEGKAAGIRR
jgi:Zn-dependent protease with chaperone function